jgi:hypothetical protein
MAHLAQGSKKQEHLIEPEDINLVFQVGNETSEAASLLAQE